MLEVAPKIVSTLPINIPLYMRFSLLLAVICLITAPSVHAQSSKNAGQYLSEIEELAQEMVEHSEKASTASTVASVKEHANKVFEIVWGQLSTLEDPAQKGAVPVHGWKTRWQVDNGMFDEAFANRYGVVPPEIEDIQQLGVMGRGRAVRHYAQKIIDSESSTLLEKEKAEMVIASLNNIIGWMKMDDGVTKGERQPRVDLTREWDSPTEFWLSTADTGWLAEIYSQAVNILKVDYGNDVAEANRHAKGLLALSKKVISGVDANKDGTIEPIKMEGGLMAVMEVAQQAGLLN